MMDTQRHWCDNESCPDFGRLGAPNIKVYSVAERRLYGITCQRTFRADKGTCLETVRTPRRVWVEIVAMLVERNSLRAIRRIKHGTIDAVRHGLDRAGQQAAAVSRHVMRALPLPQAQIDALGTGVNNNTTTGTRMTRLSPGIPGFGAPSRCRVMDGS